MAGFLIGGVLVDQFDPRVMVAAAGTAGLVAVLLCVPSVRSALRREAAGLAAGSMVRDDDSFMRTTQR
jgi:hypothetical protein